MACCCGSQTGACCVVVNGSLVCQDKSLAECNAVGGVFKGNATKCSLCSDPALTGKTFTATTVFGSVSVSCNDVGSDGLLAIGPIVFPCGKGDGCAPNGGDYPTKNQILIAVYTKKCNLSPSVLYDDYRRCDARNDVTGTQIIDYNVQVNVGRVDACGNLGTTEEWATLFNVSVSGGSVSIAKLQTNNVGFEDPTTFQRCKPCGADGRFTVSTNRIDCCPTDLSVSLTVT